MILISNPVGVKPVWLKSFCVKKIIIYEYIPTQVPVCTGAQIIKVETQVWRIRQKDRLPENLLNISETWLSTSSPCIRVKAAYSLFQTQLTKTKTRLNSQRFLYRIKNRRKWITFMKIEKYLYSFPFIIHVFHRILWF